MSDRRVTPANGRVAAAHLRGTVEAKQYVTGATGHLTVPFADLLNAPDGKRERQLLMGDDVSVFEDHDGWCYVQARRDGYVGYLPRNVLSEGEGRATHWVNGRATHVYSDADFKSPERFSLSHMSRLEVIGEQGRFVQTSSGFVPSAHVSPLSENFAVDPVGVSEIYLGTPYLWGGNSAFGLDCSGLVQAGCLACGIACPGDSDLQQRELGHLMPDDAPLQRGDLLFWKGHVAWVADETRLIHANAYHMAVVYEEIDTAITRIKAQGDGPVTAHKRLKGLT